MELNPVFVEARDIPDSWFQLVYNILDKGRVFTIDKGSYAGQTRLEYDYVTVRIKHPEVGAFTPDILPQIPASCGIPNPVDYEYVYGGKEHKRSYIEYLMEGEVHENEQYTYGSRLVHAHAGSTIRWEGSKEWNEPIFIDQIQKIISTYKEFGSRNNQMVLQIAQPGDIKLEDPPCLRHIDTRIQDEKLHFFIYFRSWDLWGGYPANLAAIQALQQYMADEIGVKTGEMICSSKGLHLYGYAEDLAKMRCLKD